jgi:hypothetical protein
LCCFSYFPKHEKPIKAVIRHLPANTPAQDISDGRLSLCFDLIKVKQVTTTLQSPPEEKKVITLLLFMVTLPRNPNPRRFSAYQASATSL